MNITLGSLIGNFILVAGSFLLLIVLIKKFAWDNITSTFEQRAKRFRMILMAQNLLVKKQKIWLKREKQN